MARQTKQQRMEKLAERYEYRYCRFTVERCDGAWRVADVEWRYSSWGMPVIDWVLPENNRSTLLAHVREEIDKLLWPI